LVGDGLMFGAGCLPEVPADAPPAIALDGAASRLRDEISLHVTQSLAGAAFLISRPRNEIPNKSVESNGRGGVVSEWHGG